MRNFLHIFVLSAFLLGVITPACGFMWGGQYSVIEVCSASGIEKRVVANDKTPQDTPAKKAADQCDFCFQTAHFSAHIAPPPTIEKIAFQSAKIHHLLYQDILLSRSPDSISARGPPATV